MQGTLETLNKLKNKGLKLAIISGSLNIALEKVLPDHSYYFSHIYINHLIFDGVEGENLAGINSTAFDFENKAEALKQIARKENISLDKCVFIGDHDNDIQAAEIAGLSIAFNCKSERLMQVSDVVIEKKDLREVLRHIL